MAESDFRVPVTGGIWSLRTDADLAGRGGGWAFGFLRQTPERLGPGGGSLEGWS